MTDRDVEKELEANEERAEKHKEDGGLAESIEELLEPVVELIEGDDKPDAETERERTKENDAEQH